MKVGDLVKWSGWEYPILIVSTFHEISYPEVRRNKFCRCLRDGDYVTLLESQLELINESR